MAFSADDQTATPCLAHCGGKGKQCTQTCFKRVTFFPFNGNMEALVRVIRPRYPSVILETALNAIDPRWGAVVSFHARETGDGEETQARAKPLNYTRFTLTD